MVIKAIFWFRRDLRLRDNVGLARAVRESSWLLPVFVFDGTILKGLKPDDRRLGFIVQAVVNLNDSLQKCGTGLYVARGDPCKIICGLIRKYSIKSVFSNQAYSMPGREKDRCISQWCLRNGVSFRQFNDTLLVPVDRIPTRKVFSAFFRKWKCEIPDVRILRRPSFPPVTVKLPSLKRIVAGLSFRESPHWPLSLGGKRLKRFDYCSYPETRNLPALDGTSRLSPFLRFGIVSIRQVYKHAASLSCPTESFISELAWREFWYHVMDRFPETRDLEFQEKRRNIPWKHKAAWLDAWKRGETGYPLVDAGMRQLLEEGWIHNRVRMVAASFLTKDLCHDWREGEKHFARHLMDYDENVNIGNWQWSASTGADPKPLRIFNPCLQSKRFDHEAAYIKRYIPALKDLPPKQIHDPLKYDLGYARPIVDHYVMREEAEDMYYSTGI